MTYRIVHLLLASAVVTGTAVGCGTSPVARFYTLASTATAHGDTAPYTVGVDPVSVPASVDRPQFVVEVAPNRVEIDEFNRWAAPLDQSIARTVAGNLALLLGTPNVAAGSFAGLTPAYRVAIDVQRFESRRGVDVVIDAVWVVRRTAGGNPKAGRTMAREAVPNDSYDALAAAHSRALVRLSTDIAEAIHVVAGTTK
jgi:uncharacterized lipoprotein YmbA